jgi:RND family efflux transporter MFP subunit
MKRRLIMTVSRVVAPLLVLAASVAAYAVLHATKPEPEKEEAGPRPVSVYTAEVVPQRGSLQVATQGEVRARTEIDLVSQVGGRIVEVSPEFTEGGNFQPGDALLLIEETDYRLALNQARARVAEAQVELEQALADADVARKQLRNEPDASPLALKKPQVTRARTRLEAARADLEQAKLNLERTRLSLPFEGRLINTRVDVGQFITPGTVVGRAFATDVVEIRLPLNNAQLASLRLPIGYTAALGEGPPVTLSAEVAGRRHTWRGRLQRLDAVIDPQTRLLYGIARVHDPYGRNSSEQGMPLAVGLFVDASIEAPAHDGAVSIPGSALHAGNQVYVLNAEGLLEVRGVTVAQANAEQVIVSAGLQVGEQVITSAIRNPIQGMALKAVDKTGAE